MTQSKDEMTASAVLAYNVATVQRVLGEWAQAIRGDWGSIDGRTCRDQLDDLAEALTSDTKTDIKQLRDDSGICPHGGGHWTMYCTDSCESDYR